MCVADHLHDHHDTGASLAGADKTSEERYLEIIGPLQFGEQSLHSVPYFCSWFYLLFVQVSSR
jgi:hypothetical protein